MALVSPGLAISVIDESQYVSGAIGTVPFVLLATAENKLYNNSVASYTRKSVAGQLLAVTSQRDLVTNFGYPNFERSAAGSPLHGNELNEYGLMAAYSALGVSNLMYIIRADIDLSQLTGTSIRPIGEAAHGTYWLDTEKTSWGIYEWNATTEEFVSKRATLISAAGDTDTINGILTPKANVGAVGSYAVISSSPYNYVFYKRSDNIWVQVGSTGWQEAFPTVTGSVANPVIVPNSTLTINTVTVTLLGTTVQLAAAAISSANIPGVNAVVVNNRIVFLVTAAAMSDGVTPDGKLVIADGVSAPVVTMGITVGTYYAPTISYGGYVSVPDWRATDDMPRPSGSVWVKTSILGGGANLVIKEYDATTNAWTVLSTPVYSGDTEAIYALDPASGGNGIKSGTLYIKQDALDNGTVSLRPYIRQTQGALKVIGDMPTAPMVFTVGDAFEISATQVDSNVDMTTIITLTSSSSASLVSDVLAANVPFLTASLEANGSIAIGHSQGGSIVMRNIVGTPLTTAGFTTTTTGVRTIPGTNDLLLSNFAPLIYTYSLTAPYTAPADGTLWYYNSPLDCDIMINEVTGWKGYRNVSRDARGYNLVNTDPAGPIFSPVTPTSQSDNTDLAAGDLWINTGDLANFPVISRYTGTKWVLIDNTESIDQNGIVFADARWDTTGTADPAAGAMPEISNMLTSNYIDLDCPDHRLYPRGTLLFNLRRSGYNVKHYVADYFNDQAYPGETLPTQHATWVTSSGLQNSGAPFAGSQAQRNMVVKAMKAAIDSSDTLRESSFQFNLQVCPGYPELIPNMVALNNDRKNTAFTLGDTPMHLPVNAIAINNWSTNANGDGLSTADPYMGVYYPSGLTSDLQGNTIVVPATHSVLRAAIKSDSVSYPWFAFAGTRRGLVDNMTDIGYVNKSTGAFVRNGINQGMRDSLYSQAINPITILPGVGLTIFGNKTRIGVASALDRVNVARLINFVRTIFASVGDGFLFEPNDQQTRDQISHIMSSALNDLVVKRGIYDYIVVCDKSNNTADRVARNELYVDIAISPMKSVEFIYVPIRIVNPGTLGG